MLVGVGGGERGLEPGEGFEGRLAQEERGAGATPPTAAADAALCVVCRWLGRDASAVSRFDRFDGSVDSIDRPTHRTPFCAA